MMGDLELLKRSKALRLRKLLFAAFAVLAVAATPVVSIPSLAQAAPVVGFKPGNIISDSLFYYGNAMSATEVQTFLNQQVPNCTIGTASHKQPGSTEQTANPVASKCLKDFTMTTSSRAADSYCSAYTGAANETAAQIIAKVGAACGISQKVILVMLQKEQGLVRDSWPTTRMYNFAMGMNCPDSGPNNSANCNSDSAGFFLQVYLGARQLNVYKANPNSYNYKPFQTNTIKWHTNSSCGTSQVHIENWATAGLYIYTPYRPNQAALNNEFGTGDSCSTYGNRNFFSYYKLWFGDPNGQPAYAMTNGVTSYWQSNRAWLGLPTGAARSVTANGGGRIQDFQGGFVYESTQGAVVAFTSTSPIITAYGAAGGIEGSWGWPLAAAVSYGSGNTVVRFQGGAVVEASGVGVFLVPEASRAAWEASGGFSGQLGYPTASAAAISDGTAQNFQKGNLYRSSAGSFALPNGNVRTAYLAAGGPQGQWGWPRGRLLCASDATSCTMDFVKGVATWSTSRGSLFTPLGSPSVTSPATPGSGEKVVGGAV